jgi:hypothetical protein
MTGRQEVRDEGGFVLATAIAVLSVVLLLGLAALQTVDVQSHQTSHEAAGEAAFNLAESALEAETFQLQLSWPSAGPGWPVCTQSSAPAVGCPGTSLTSSFGSAYSGTLFGNPVWKVQVLDPPTGQNYYSDSLLGTAPAYDLNHGSRLWVRAEATIQGQRRILVAEVVRQSAVVALPHNAITAGGVYTSNRGNKVIIESRDPNSGLTGSVALRCGASNTTPVYGNTCAGWDPNKGQLDPAGNYQAGYVDPGGGYSTLSSDALQLLKATAIANNTYYAVGQCPPAGQTGVVYVENANCSYTGNTTWNSSALPGALIFANGSVSFNGTVNFYGVIYMANTLDAPPSAGACTSAYLQQDGTILTVHGNGTIFGSLFVDKCGMVNAGSSAFNIEYDSKVFSAFAAYESPVMAKNTFQIVPNS